MRFVEPLVQKYYLLAAHIQLDHISWTNSSGDRLKEYDVMDKDEDVLCCAVMRAVETTAWRHHWWRNFNTSRNRVAPRTVTECHRSFVTGWSEGLFAHRRVHGTRHGVTQNNNSCDSTCDLYDVIGKDQGQTEALTLLSWIRVPEVSQKGSLTLTEYDEP